MEAEISWTENYGRKLIKFYRQAIQTRSYSDEEGDMARLVEEKMKELGYDQTYIDRVGNVIGRVGNGPRIIHFDSHMDNVQVNDPENWIAPPFGGEIVNGMVYGRGASAAWAYACRFHGIPIAIS